jgi:c(7)-type cytochrome triheme protein
MKKLVGIFLLLTLEFSVVVLAAAEKTPPKEKIVFTAKPGNVSFNHATHVKAEKGKCDTCHTALFPQAKAPIHFKPPHSKEEAAKTSCGFCHRDGGQAFTTKGNCTNSKCHVKEAAKS